MIPISAWYASLGEWSFPTVFLRLSAAERQALATGNTTAPEAKPVIERIERAMNSLPHWAFVGADVCAPTDSPQFRPGKGLTSGRTAWQWLTGSAKVQAAFRENHTERLTVRPFRRMDKTREFRMFIRDGRLSAMSQYCLERHFARLDKRVDQVWQKGLEFAALLQPFLPAASVVADVYLTSDGNLMLLDFNPWGAPTSPLLLRTWERDWQQPAGLKLIPEPITMKGDVSVSF